MKIYTTFCLAALLTGGVSGALPVARAQAASAETGYADEVVATVGARKITRRDVVADYACYQPKILGAALLERYPQLERTMTIDMDAICRSAFASKSAEFDNVVERLLILNALEEAAARRNIQVTADEVNAQTHHDLEARQKSLELPEAPDEEVARKLGDNLVLLRQTAREVLLKRRLVLSDLNDRLGHPIGNADYYRVHGIFTRVNDAQGVFDPKATLAKIQSQRAEILTKKRTFEEIAKAESQDASKGRGGAFGPLTRKLLKNEIDDALAKMNPNEITPPIEVQGGYAIFRLDKRGADLTDAERKTAIATYLKSEKRAQNAIANTVRDIPWTTTIGKTPEWLKLSDETETASAAKSRP